MYATVNQQRRQALQAGSAALIGDLFSAQGGYRVGCVWQHGEITSYVIHAKPNTAPVNGICNGRVVTMTPLLP